MESGDGVSERVRTYPTPVHPDLILRPILGSPNELKVGEQRSSMRDAGGRQHPDQPWVVLREVTFDDWLHYVQQMAAMLKEDVPPGLIAEARRGLRFYEISTD